MVLQLKSTPLVATITVVDVYAIISRVRQETFLTYEPLLLLALIYLCLTGVPGLRFQEARKPHTHSWRMTSAALDGAVTSALLRWTFFHCASERGQGLQFSTDEESWLRISGFCPACSPRRAERSGSAAKAQSAMRASLRLSPARSRMQHRSFQEAA
jgi:hypothetical protein